MTSRRLCLLAPLLILAACAGWPGSDAVRVNLVGLEALPGEGFEWRMAVKLRVQNPNDTPLHYDGVALTLDVRGHEFASGVSDARGTVPRFGEALLVVPVSVSATAIVKQVFSFARGEGGKIDFVARGKLSGTGAAAARFETQGEFDLPAGLAGAR